MPTLQSSFRYDGNASASVSTTINLLFKVPVFEFSTVLVNGKPFIKRDLLGEQPVSINRKLADTSYEASFKNEYLTGNSDTSVLNFLNLISRIGFSNTEAGLLDDLSAEIPVLITDEHKNLAGHLSMKALYSLSTASSTYKEITERQASLNRSVSINTATADDLKNKLAAYARKNIFLVNREVFAEAAAQFRMAEPQYNDYAFLFIISHVTDLSSGKPRIKTDAEEIKVFLKEHFSIDKPERVKAVLKLITTALFDFPVTVPEIKAMEVKGTFKIVSDAAVTLNDFRFYTLAVEYPVDVPGNGIRPQSLLFDWTSVPAAEINNNTIVFSFAPVISNYINGNVQVRVTGYDGSEVWQREYAPENKELQKLTIEVALLKPTAISPGAEPRPVAGNKKLSGKIIELSGDCNLKEATVVIQAKKEADTMWRIVGAASTDASGNFSLPYPYGNYTAAQALVSLTPNSPADIPVYSDQEHIAANETIADDFLYLLIQGADCAAHDHAEEEDCACHDEKKSNRLPSQEDLLASDSYTQDIGGSCINLSTPNRTLNEYSHTAIVRTSDPDVANYILTKDLKGHFRLEGGTTKIDRKPVDLSNPILWQDAPDDHNNLSLYQAVKVATGHILHYSVVTKADGYSMGELLYSLPLAPGQKKQIVMFEQSHTLRGSETQRISQRESLAASLVNDVDISDTIAGNIDEEISGSSSATTGGVSGGFGLGAIIDAVGISLGVSGGVANAHSNASQNSSRTISAYFHERMKNSITQNAQSYREMNATVITTVEEGQRYGVTSEVIANHNHCHSLTMMYFEVLKHYAIYQEITHVEECLFVPLLMTDFTIDNIYKWKDVLAMHLLPIPSDTYLQPFVKIKTGRLHPLLKAFDAIERYRTNYVNVSFPEFSYADDPITSLTGYLTLKLNIPRPKTIFDRILSFRKMKINTLFGPYILGILQVPDNYIVIYDDIEEARPADVIEVVKFDNFFPAGSNDGKLWDAIARLCGYNNTEEFLENYFSHKTISKWTDIFNDEILPMVFEELANNSIGIAPFSQVDVSTTTKYHGGDKLMRLNFRANTSLARKDINNIRVNYTKAILHSVDFWQFVTFNIQNIQINYSTKFYSGVIINKFLGDDLYDSTLPIATPMNSDEQRNPRKEDEYIILKLIEHLNSNLEYYNKCLWKKLDKDRLYMLLDGFNVETYNDFGVPVGYRSLASVVKNELIGIAGNSLVMPVAPGYKIDRTYIVEQNADGVSEEINLLEHYKPLTPVPPYRISLPSKGVFAEAVQGACDACEKVKDNTSQDWDKFKTDEPTAINPVTVPVPTVTDWKAAFKDLATPIVNIQNAPAAAAPGAGLAASGIADLLGKSDVFKDVTGLDQNQKNAMQTYLSNQENAKAFAEMAKVMAMQGHNTEHSDKIADAIRNSPELSDEEKAQLLKDHFGQMVDGGQSKKAEQDAAAKTNEPTAMGIAKDAEAKGKTVKAETQDSEGNTQKVEVGAGSSSTNVLAEAKGHLPKLAQTSSSTCWAFAATIMMSWKKGKTLTVEEVLTEAGEQYLQKFMANDTLRASEKDEFVQSLDMTGEPPASYLLQQYIDWVNTYGPLWITTDAAEDESFSPHARILFKITGNGNSDGIGTDFHFIDPDGGSEQKEPFTQFLKKYEQAATDNPSENLLIQIVHFSDAKEIGEGAGTPAKVNLAVSWTGVNNGDLDADIQVLNSNTILGSGTGNGSATVLVDWKKSYTIVVTPRLNGAADSNPDKMYVKTKVAKTNTASKTNGDPASLSASVRLQVNRWNLTHVHTSWTNEGVVRSKAEDVMSKVFLGRSVVINKLIEARVDRTQADFDALPADELQRIKDSITKIGSRAMRTMTGTEGTFSNHSLGCAFDVSENIDTMQNHHFLEVADQSLLKLVQEVVQEQVAGWNTFDIVADKGLRQLDASNHFTIEFPKWLHTYATTLAPEASDSSLAEIPWPDYYSDARLKKMIQALDGTLQEKERLEPLFKTIINYKQILTTWMSGINIGGVWLTGMISMDRKFLEIMLANGWRWGGDYDSLRKDYMHFEDMNAVALIQTP
ncbi:MAG: papain-like cysteine protease family protein [Ferruginibacter sp.]